MRMPTLATYLLAGSMIVLAMDFVAPPAGMGLNISAWPQIEDSATQTVNRADKQNRLPLPVANKRPLPAAPAQHVLVGCEPVFSPLSAAAKLNYPGRCMA
jgi:hypothetical protein